MSKRPQHDSAREVTIIMWLVIGLLIVIVGGHLIRGLAEFIAILKYIFL